MATPLGLGLELLQKFDIIFPFLLIFAVAFIGLGYLKALNDNKGIHALAAAALALMTIFSRVAVKTINRTAPWFVLVFIFIFFTILTFRLMGYSEDYVTKTLTHKSHSGTFFWWTFAIILIIALGSLTSVISEEQGFQSLTDANITATEEQNDFFTILFNPQVLGMILILLIALITVHHMTKVE
jgi:uncharacterized membrane protein